MKILACVFLLASPLMAQQVQKPLTVSEWALLASDAGVRSLDVYSTHQALENPMNKEDFLPHFVAYHPAVMSGMEVGIVGLEYLAMRKLNHHHPILAHLVPIVDAAIDGPYAIHNLYLPARTQPVRLRP